MTRSGRVCKQIVGVNVVNFVFALNRGMLSFKSLQRGRYPNSRLA